MAGRACRITRKIEMPEPPKSLLERLASEPLVFDGALGTSLHEHGLSFDYCFESVSIEHPEWVLEIHRRFLKAGAVGIQTNTYGAHRLKLARHGLSDRLEDFLRASVALSREAAGVDRYVLGALGPLGAAVEPLGRLSREEACAHFLESLEIMADAGVDGFSLETFSNLDELIEAVKAAKQVSAAGGRGDLPVIAQVAVSRRGRTLYGTPMADVAARLGDAGADVIGVNCSGGPRTVLNAVLELLAATNLPVSARPNAGVPREVEGRLFYENNPDYFARFARRFLQAGGRMLGGCCGTTPEHISAMVGAVRMAGAQDRGTIAAESATRTVAVTESAKSKRPSKPMPLRARSNFGRLLSDHACPVSVELLPPRTSDLSSLRKAARELKAAGADLINLPDGPRASARVSNLAAATVLQRESAVECLLHFCCRDRNLLGMQSDLMGAEALGLRNMLVITGDPPYQGNYPDLTAVFDVDAIGLCNIIDNLNHGLDLGSNHLDMQTHFVFGAALNHSALDQERELKRFEWKIKTGIDFAITQPIFDADEFLDFIKHLPADSPPIMAGIWPLRSLRNTEFLASEVPGVQVADAVIERMRAADARGCAAEEGIEIAREIILALNGKVSGFQLAAPFNKVEAPIQLLETINELRCANS